MLRAGLVMWGGWLVLTGLVFSFASGIIHPYYTVVLAPAIGALLGMVLAELWGRRDRIWSRAVMAAMLVATVGWAFVLLERTPAWLPWLRWAVLLAGIAGRDRRIASAWMGRWTRSADRGGRDGPRGDRGRPGRPLAYTMATAAQPHTGPIAAAGPSGAGGSTGGPGGGQAGGRAEGYGGAR